MLATFVMYIELQFSKMVDYKGIKYSIFHKQLIINDLNPVNKIIAYFKFYNL